MKLFVTDYDNTLYVNDEEIIETIKELNELKKRNVKIMISTGRSLPSIRSEIKKHHIPFDYLSCADGSIIYDQDYNLLKIYPISQKIIKEIKNLTKNINYEELQISYIDGYSNILDLTKQISSINIVVHHKNYTKQLEDKFNNLKINYPNYNYVIYSHYFNNINSYLYYMCIKKNKVNKAMSIKYIANKLKISKKDIYVIGDSDNDIEMIKEYNGVCVSNATDLIKNNSQKIYNKISDYIKEI